MSSTSMPRRKFLQVSAAGLAGLAAVETAAAAAPVPQGTGVPGGDDKPKTPTRFQIACMTLPYSRFPLQRALQGIRKAGYSFVAWGTSHLEDGDKQAAVMPAEVFRAVAIVSPRAARSDLSINTTI